METAKVAPLGDRVLVRVDESVKQIGRILIPDKAQKKPSAGVVLAVGEECQDYIKKLVGRKVYFHDYSGTEAPGHPEYQFLRESDLLGYEISQERIKHGYEEKDSRGSA